ncbi:hypothetical protein MF672_029860 [Actinomadura sp. ATCC 31491]|uniref:Uncharacterized protein n=1 Tax=Actinomadura luzonensis TaxID=2805427 RepID=A0ABT0G047_9ACTN|nr:hypothetical protein [Actinomadura luzonensis]MCK2217967.1 hypothetical protein [Actinomadura luzonensis]
MTGRMGRAAAVCAALGVLWWATVRVVWLGVGCEDWGCLAPSVGLLVVISLVLLAGSVRVLDRVDVRPGRRVAAAAAGTLVVFRLAGEALPSWTSQWADLAAAGAAFAAAGAVAAFVTETKVARGWRLATGLALVALLPIALAMALARAGL